MYQFPTGNARLLFCLLVIATERINSLRVMQDVFHWITTNPPLSINSLRVMQDSSFTSHCLFSACINSLRVMQDHAVRHSWIWSYPMQKGINSLRVMQDFIGVSISPTQWRINSLRVMQDAECARTHRGDAGINSLRVMQDSIHADDCEPVAYQFPTGNARLCQRLSIDERNSINSLRVMQDLRFAALPYCPFSVSYQFPTGNARPERG